MQMQGGSAVQIHIQECPELEETEITLRCRQTDEQVLRILALLRVFDRKLTGVREGETFLLDAAEVLYIDTADKRTFFYTAGGVYETPLKLYELAERLAPYDFFRAGKSMVVNFNQIQSLRPEFGGRMQLTMSNGESVFVSRQYVPTIKQKLGLIQEVRG